MVTAAALVMAATLLWAGLEKARNLAPTVAIIRRFGLPHRLSRLAALFVATTEIALAIAVLFRPDAIFTQISIVVLSGMFGIAGLIALGFDEPVRCNCFGPGGNGYLGIAQLVAFFPWLAGALLLQFGIFETPSLETGAAYFATTSLGIASAKGIGVLKSSREARADRVSARGMYAWLRSH